MGRKRFGCKCLPQLEPGETTTYSNGDVVCDSCGGIVAYKVSLNGPTPPFPYSGQERPSESERPMSIEIIKETDHRLTGMPSVLYRPYVGGKALSCLAETEDIAMLLAIGHKYDGRNSQFAKFACRMLRLPTVWVE